MHVTFTVVALSLAVVLILNGYYLTRINALENNPVTKVQIVPRTLYEEQLGIDWTSTASAVQRKN